MHKVLVVQLKNCIWTGPTSLRPPSGPGISRGMFFICFTSLFWQGFGDSRWDWPPRCLWTSTRYAPGSKKRVSHFRPNSLSITWSLQNILLQEFQPRDSSDSSFYMVKTMHFLYTTFKVSNSLKNRSVVKLFPTLKRLHFVGGVTNHIFNRFLRGF